jgi:hypothetical protein
MGIKLTDVSPLASMIEGEGIAEYMGVIPAAITRRTKKRKEKKEKERLAAEQAEKQGMGKAMSGAGGIGGIGGTAGMKAGGRVKSIDGMAIRGKTKGRIV